MCLVTKSDYFLVPTAQDLIHSKYETLPYEENAAKSVSSDANNPVYLWPMWHWSPLDHSGRPDWPCP